MVRSCIACPNREKLSKSITFHALPADLHLRHIWLKRLNRLDLNDFSNRKVCCAHFSPSSFSIKSRKNTNGNGRARLKSGALPIENGSTTATITMTHSRSIAVQTDLDMVALADSLGKASLLDQNVIETTICIERFQHDDSNIKYYTGFRSYNLFKMVFELLEVRKLRLPANCHLQIPVLFLRLVQTIWWAFYCIPVSIRIQRALQ